MIKQKFLAVLTKDPDEATSAYVKKTGFVPTILLIRPNFIPSKDSPLFARSRHASWGLISVSHLITPADVANDENPDAVIGSGGFDIDKAANLPHADYSFPDAKIGRPEKKTKAVCPHCHGFIMSFETLGYWYGWNFGVVPPYWDELRMYVFRRDDFRCQKCKKKYPPALLNAHHINPKETGGEDGSRNLQTLCQYCHDDLKPMFEDKA